MKPILIAIASLALITSPLTHAKRGKSSSGGYSKKSSSGYSKRGYSRGSYGSGCYGCYGSSTTTTATPAPVVLPPKYFATTIRKAGVRTCASKHCTVVKYLPKGQQVKWSGSQNGFVNLHDSPYWIISTDLK